MLSVMPIIRHPVAPISLNEMCVAGAPRTPLAGSSSTSLSSLTYLHAMCKVSLVKIHLVDLI